MAGIRARRWCFTINNYEVEDTEVLQDINCRYVVWGREAGEQGTVHLQGYIVFKNPVSFQSLKKKLPKAHLEVARKPHAANIKYCKKDGVFWERGELPKNKEEFKKPEDVKFKDLHAHLAGMRLLKGVEKENEMLNEIRNDDLQKPTIIYIHGESGTGKTYTAYKMATEKYPNKEIASLDFKNQFAISNNFHAKCLILPEFRPSSIDAATFLQFTDGYGMILNVKHGQVYIRPEMVIVCSIKHPREIYRDEINTQFMRRLTFIINKDEDPYHDSDTELDLGDW